MCMPTTSVPQCKFKGSHIQALTLVLETGSIDHLEVAFGAGRPAVNLKNLINGVVKGKKTIQFCQNAGTFDGDRMQAWIQTVGGIVKWWRKVSGIEYEGRPCLGSMPRRKMRVTFPELLLY